MLATPLLQMMCSIKFSPTNGMQRTLSMVMWLKTTMSRLHQRTTGSTTACSCHQCVFVRRQCLVDIPFDIHHRLSADYKFFIQQYQQGARFQYINMPIAIFDTTGVSNSKRSSGLFDNIKVVCETIPFPQRIKFVARLAVPYIMCRLKGK